MRVTKRHNTTNRTEKGIDLLPNIILTKRNVIYLQRHAICFTTAFYRYYYLLFFRHTLTIRMIVNYCLWACDGKSLWFTMRQVFIGYCVEHRWLRIEVNANSMVLSSQNEQSLLPGYEERLQIDACLYL